VADILFFQLSAVIESNVTHVGRHVGRLGECVVVRRQFIRWDAHLLYLLRVGAFHIACFICCFLGIVDEQHLVSL